MGYLENERFELLALGGQAEMMGTVREGFADSMVGQMCESVGDSEQGGFVLICNDGTDGREFVAFEYYENGGWRVALVWRNADWIIDAWQWLKALKNEVNSDGLAFALDSWRLGNLRCKR